MQRKVVLNVAFAFALKKQEEKWREISFENPEVDKLVPIVNADFLKVHSLGKKKFEIFYFDKKLETRFITSSVCFCSVKNLREKQKTYYRIIEGLFKVFVFNINDLVCFVYCDPHPPSFD